MDLKRRLKSLINEKFYGKSADQIRNVVFEFTYDPEKFKDGECDEKIKEIKYFLNTINITAFNHFKPINKISIIATEDLSEKVVSLMRDFGFECEKALAHDTQPSDKNRLELAYQVRESFLLEMEERRIIEGTDEKIILFDFDGTVRSVLDATEKGTGEKRPPLKPEEVSVFPGVGEKIKEWQNNGWTIVGASNQKGTLRRREFVPPENRETSTELENAQIAGKTFRKTLDDLGVDFPVYFAADNDVYVLEGNSVKHAGSFKNAYKPNPAMGNVIKKRFGSEIKYMVGDYPPDDAAFASAIGAEFIPAEEFLNYLVGGVEDNIN
jgi:histidinol phosphatase-like enzyme